MMHDFNAANHRQRREQALLDTKNCCSRCHKAFFVVRLSRAYNLKIEQAHLHHPDNNPEDPEARVEVLCDSCHMAAHRQPDPGQSKAPPRKKGYEVVPLPLLRKHVRCAGLVLADTEDGTTTWCIGDLSGEAEDTVEAIELAIHWMDGEIRTLREKLQAAGVPTDTMGGIA
jgi:hypothetical protein